MSNKLPLYVVTFNFFDGSTQEVWVNTTGFHTAINSAIAACAYDLDVNSIDPSKVANTYVEKC